MRKYLINTLLILLLTPSLMIAKEGMWIPMLLEKINADEMKAMGMKISADEIYSLNKSSLKDAIVLFGGGCTAEIISDQGLLLTNHHCGYRNIQRHSTVEHDYLTDGFWAEDLKSELANPGLTAKRLEKMEDVSQKVLKDVSEEMSEEARNSVIRNNIKKLIAEIETDEFNTAEIKAFYKGNQYILLYYTIFKDVRLVGAPPSNIGKFGGDTDNWMWPRHTGDFSVFRIYVDENNKAANYSPDNKPLKPKKHLTISLKGVEKGDFTFVFGYPARTNEYLPSYAIDLQVNKVNPFRIDIRGKRLANMMAEMETSKKVRIQYSAKYAGVANGWKKWIGQNRGIAKLNAIEKKQNFEKEFTVWAQDKPEYKNLLSAFENVYGKLEAYEMAFQYFVESGYSMEMTSFISKFYKLIKLSEVEDPDNEAIKVETERLQRATENFFKDYFKTIDKNNFKLLLNTYLEMPYDKELMPDKFIEIKDKYDGKLDKYVDKLYKKSFFDNENELIEFLADYKAKDVKKINSDPYFELVNSMFTNYREINPKISAYNNTIDSLMRIYMKAQMEMQKDKQFYPDANFTLRVAYGKVKPYTPRDGVNYKYYTTLDGIMEKENPDIYDYVVEDKLKELYNEKNYGQYGDKDGSMHVCFIASNHTSGGNSGSPVFNADGHLIGVNFDRNWEGTQSDLMYDPTQCRNISLDIRYCLFIIDKFAGASRLIEEMTLVK